MPCEHILGNDHWSESSFDQEFAKPTNTMLHALRFPNLIDLFLGQWESHMKCVHPPYTQVKPPRKDVAPEL